MKCIVYLVGSYWSLAYILHVSFIFFFFQPDTIPIIHHLCQGDNQIRVWYRHRAFSRYPDSLIRIWPVGLAEYTTTVCGSSESKLTSQGSSAVVQGLATGIRWSRIVAESQVRRFGRDETPHRGDGLRAPIGQSPAGLCD